MTILLDESPPVTFTSFHIDAGSASKDIMLLKTTNDYKKLYHPRDFATATRRPACAAPGILSRRELQRIVADLIG